MFMTNITMGCSPHPHDQAIVIPPVTKMLLGFLPVRFPHDRIFHIDKRGSCKTSCGMGVPPMNHGQDARATLTDRRFCKSLKSRGEGGYRIMITVPLGGVMSYRMITMPEPPLPPL